MTNLDGEGTRDAVLRDLAMKQPKKRRDFHGHLLVYALVNGFLIVIWAMTNQQDFFWQLFPLVGWGIGVVMTAWDVYGAHDFTEEQIQREMQRLAHGH